MDAAKKVTKFFAKLIGKPTPTAEFEIDGTTEIDRFDDHIRGWANNGQPEKIGYVNYSFSTINFHF
jgi:hypothetical protein